MRRTHLLAHQLLHLGPLIVGDLDDQLVMHLQQHPRPHVVVPQRTVHAQHRDLDDVGGAALDRRVERHSLGHLPPLPVVAGQIGQITAPPQDRRGVAVLARLVDDLPQVVADPAEPGEIGVHLRLGVLGGDPQLLRQPVGRQAVGQPVGHRLDPAPQFVVDLADRHPESPGGDIVMQILTGAERLDEPLVAGEVRHDAHLDLAVVGRHQLRVAAADDEDLPDPAALLGANRDVLQVRIGRGQPAGGRDRLVQRGVDPPIVRNGLHQTVHSGLQPGGIAMFQQVLQEGVLGLLVKRLQRLGVGGVTGLGALGLRHVQLVEQHHLQLLGRTEVDLFADHAVGVLRGLLDPGGKTRAQLGELLGVDRDARALQLAEHHEQRQLQVGEQATAVDAVQLRVERVRQLRHRTGSDQFGGRGLLPGLRLVFQQRQLAVVLALLRSQLTLQVADDEIRQFEGPLPGPHQVRGQCGIAGQARQRPAAVADGVQRPLDIVRRLGRSGVGQPGRQRLLIFLRQRADIDECTRAVSGGERDAGQVAVAARPLPGARQPDPVAVAGVLVQPRRQLAGLHEPTGDLEALLHLGLGAGQRREQPVAQHPELQVVEQPVHRIAVPGTRRQVRRHRLQRNVANQLGQLPVEQHRRQVLAQRRTGLALDLVHPVHQVSQRAELLDPLGDGLFPHPRDLRQVVRRVAAQRREVRVLLRRQAVLVLDGLRGEAGELRDALGWVQHRDVVGDQLQRIPVPGTDRDAEALRGGLRGQRRDDVVGLVVLLAQHRDVERAQDVLDQADLAAELVRRGAAIGLVIGEGLAAEGLAGDVEGDGEVGGRLVAEQVDQHRGEAVDRVGVLPGAGLEVLLRQGVEGAVGHRVAVNEQQASVLGIRHGGESRLKSRQLVPEATGGPSGGCVQRW